MVIRILPRVWGLSYHLQHCKYWWPSSKPSSGYCLKSSAIYFTSESSNKLELFTWLYDLKSFLCNRSSRNHVNSFHILQLLNVTLCMNLGLWTKKKSWNGSVRNMNTHPLYLNPLLISGIIYAVIIAYIYQQNQYNYSWYINKIQRETIKVKNFSAFATNLCISGCKW